MIRMTIKVVDNCPAFEREPLMSILFEFIKTTPPPVEVEVVSVSVVSVDVTDVTVAVTDVTVVDDLVVVVAQQSQP